MSKKWTEEEENFLWENFAKDDLLAIPKDDDVKELAKGLRELGYYRSDGAIKSRLRRFRTITIEIDEHKLHPEKEVVFETDYNQGEEYQESKKQVEEIEVAEENNAIVLDDIEVDIPVEVSEPTASRFTWIILLAASLGLVLYGVYN